MAKPDKQLSAGDELDALVAGDIMLWHTSKISEKVWYMPLESNSTLKDQFKPSTDVGAAFRVVERMRRNGFGFKFSTKSFAKDQGYNWAYFYNVHDEPEGIAQGHTPAEAICLAALEACWWRSKSNG